MSGQTIGIQPGRSSGVVDTTGPTQGELAAKILALEELAKTLVRNRQVGEPVLWVGFPLFKWTAKGFSSSTTTITIAELTSISAVVFQPFSGGGSANVGVQAIEGNKIKAIINTGFEVGVGGEMGAFLFVLGK